MKIGILLINLGTPDAPTPPAVRRYLRQFLSDPRVIDINPIIRWMLLRLIILPIRSRKSAQAYQEIWSDQGSPLLVYSQQFADKVKQNFENSQIPVVLGMRYGNPSIESAIQHLKEEGCDHLVVFPLFPHYASSSSGSAIEEVYRQSCKYWNTPFIQIIPPFYQHPSFISSFVAVGKPFIDQKPDYVLFSFHGLPERHVIKSDHTNEHCLQKEDCCAKMVDANRNCYRAQCFRTVELLAQELNIHKSQYEVTFQSRLGRTPWIQPYTDEKVLELAKRGIKKLVVFCPAFVADCLETLEEIGIGLKESFEEAGGEKLELVPSLNASRAWVQAATYILRENIKL